jgi:hypothetical protein
MSLIEKIKTQVGRLILSREAREHKRHHKLVALGEANHIGIVYNAENSRDEQLVNSYANQLRSEGKKVFTMGYVDQKELHHSKKFSINSEFFWKEKLNGFNLPIRGKIGQFLEIEFDLLLNLYLEPVLPMQAIAAYSNARYRVGSNIDGALEYYDAMIDTGGRKDLGFLINQIDFYLKHIK